jgi:hypothetical protein
MALTTDPPVCGEAFVEAMRANPLAGDNVDRDDVKPNLFALGGAVRTILVDEAEIISDAASDAAFWQWVAGLSAWAKQMEAWRSSVRAAFNDWTPADGSGKALKKAVLEASQPPAGPPAAPTRVKGRIV